MTWQQAAWLAIACAVVWLGTARRLHGARAAPRSLPLRLARGARGVLFEVGLVAALYALWQWVFSVTVTQTAGGLDHGRAIFHFEQRIGLPSERTVQQLTLHSRYLIEFLNRYYATVHVPALGILLVWLFFRHRAHYPRVRNVLAISTGACLALQSIPVAPPRFLPDLGFVDTALLFHQSVYGAGGSGISNQLAAMPSVHILWSTLVAAAAVWASRSRWRWLVLAHPVLTWWAVVATGNHWWLDGLVSVALLLVALGLLEGAARLRRRLWPPRVERSPGSTAGTTPHDPPRPQGAPWPSTPTTPSPRSSAARSASSR